MNKKISASKTGKKKTGRARKHAQQVRIIGGLWKRSTLPVVDAEGLRPTSDRIRETVFNWIHHQIGGEWKNLVCLDLFAGTGALGFEAASRGAAQVMLVESHPAAVRQLEAAKEKLHAEQVIVVRGDALAVASRLVADPKHVDLVFLDPPYDQGWLPRVLPVCAGLLKEKGLVYLESSEPLDKQGEGEPPDWFKGWEILRQDRAGAVFYYLLKMAR